MRSRAVDGLRGLAVGAVIVRHYFVGRHLGLAGIWALYGEMLASAVSVFFVISGYLVGRGLLKGRPLSEHYVRRFARTLPLWWLVAGGAWALGRAPWWVVPFPLAAFLGHSIDDTIAPGWSLTVEELFYLVAPLALVPAVRARGLPWLIGAAFLARIGGAAALGGDAYPIPLCRVDAILLGVWLAVWTPPRWVSRVAALTGAAAWLACPWVYLAIGDAWWAVYTAAAAVWTWGVLPDLLEHGFRPLEAAPLVGGGVRCYGLYLLHMPALAAAMSLFPASPRVGVCAALLISGIGSAMSWRLIEAPAIAWSRGSRWQTIERLSCWLSSARSSLLASTASTPGTRS